MCRREGFFGCFFQDPDNATGTVHFDQLAILQQEGGVIQSVVYHFSHVGGGCRAALKAVADRERPAVPSIQDIYPGANWHERETHDFYGVVFEGHPDLSPLILPEDAGHLRPLRKDGESLKALGGLIPEFAPPPGEGGAPEKTEKPRPKREAAPPGEGSP